MSKHGQKRLVQVSSYRVISFKNGLFHIALRFAEDGKIGHILMKTPEIERHTIPREIEGYWLDIDGLSEEDPDQFICTDPGLNNFIAEG